MNIIMCVNFFFYMPSITKSCKNITGSSAKPRFLQVEKPTKIIVFFFLRRRSAYKAPTTTPLSFGRQVSEKTSAKYATDTS